MHATRARLPQKRTQSKKSAVKKTAAKKPALQPESQALPAGVASLAAHRAAAPLRAPLGVEIFALVEWIAPARESWRRGELEVRRSACMPMTALRQSDGTLALTDLPGQGDPLQIAPATIGALLSGDAPTLRLSLPGMRVTLTADALRPALPTPRRAQVLAFRRG
jgi:hypothetical protein